MKRTRYGLIAAVLVLFVSSCSKYDDGPALALYSPEKRAQGKWYFEMVLVNGEDSTEHYYSKAIEYNLNGFFAWEQVVSYGFPDPTTIWFGDWRFNEEKDSIYMNVYHENDTVPYNWKIKRLAFDELWMEGIRGEKDTLRWNMWKLRF